MEASTAQAPAKTVLRVAAISGSLRSASANTGLMPSSAPICEESIPGLQVEHVDIYELRLLNTDLEVDGGFPPAVEACQARHGDLPGCPADGGAGARNFPRRVSVAPSPAVFAGEGESESPFASPEPADHHGLRCPSLRRKTTPLCAESRP
ncbi:putative NADPH:quinone oxidoreductase 2 [Panicum miliaceum]|uniref:NADPH:quinone oxidoreductase 2 n=1 Tax=Panicum miliaceum TaxID=4540 RepID=A0A3L6RKG5_PANMI|nr:putative NADPH:quinone oxidoreductase 2 [Panicum miliaceum]